MSKFLVYALIDPRNHEIRYIGKSCSGMNRPRAHMYPSNYNRLKTHQYNWIRKLISLNLTPIIEVLEYTKKEKLSATEMHYIRLAKEEGHKLTNHTIGGDGPTGRKVSQEVKNRLSKMYKGRKMPPEAILNMIAANTGRIHSEEENKKRSFASPKRKPITSVETGKNYTSIRQAAKAIGCDYRGLARCCKGEYKQYKGFTWKYAAL